MSAPREELRTSSQTRPFADADTDKEDMRHILPFSRNAEFANYRAPIKIPASAPETTDFQFASASGQVCLDRIGILCNEILRHLGDHRAGKRLAEAIAQISKKSRTRHHHETVKLFQSMSLREARGQFARESQPLLGLDLLAGIQAMAPRAIAVVHAPRGVRDEVPWMQS
jgi:hypothetical protein